MLLNFYQILCLHCNLSKCIRLTPIRDKLQLKSQWTRSTYNFTIFALNQVILRFNRRFHIFFIYFSFYNHRRWINQFNQIRTYNNSKILTLNQEILRFIHFVEHSLKGSSHVIVINDYINLTKFTFCKIVALNQEVLRPRSLFSRFHRTQTKPDFSYNRYKRLDQFDQTDRYDPLLRIKSRITIQSFSPVLYRFYTTQI